MDDGWRGSAHSLVLVFDVKDKLCSHWYRITPLLRVEGGWGQLLPRSFGFFRIWLVRT